MPHGRKGYTLVEMMTVVVILGTVTILTTPRLRLMRAQAAFSSARTETASYLSQARAVALQRGREARFVTAGNNITVTVDSSGTQVVFARPRNLQLAYGVSLTATRAEIAFDPRGIAIGNASMERVRIVRDSLIDSVCVTKLGKVIARGCSL
jgi:prepilin-type N-terminal cleavage/methylation domain-containing protein